MEDQQFKEGDLLQKTECMQLFMDRMRIGKRSYYDNFRQHIKFKPYGEKTDEEGNKKKTLYRIPYEVAVGLINLLLDRPQPDDPDLKTLTEFMHNVPEEV